MLTAADIRFVHLGLEIEHLRNSISVFGFRIAFYGIIIGIGMLAGIWIAQSDARRRGQDPDLILILHCMVLYFPLSVPDSTM